MGMFDSFTCDLPLDEAAIGIRSWQTKDIECAMESFALRADGQLVNAHIRMEQKPGAPTGPGMLEPGYLDWYRAWWERKEGPDEPVMFTGSIRFYGTTDSKTWVEYMAWLKHGRCREIVRLVPEPVETIWPKREPS